MKNKIIICLISIIIIGVVFSVVKNLNSNDDTLIKATIFGESIELKSNKNYYSIETDKNVKANYVNNNFIGCENNISFTPYNKKYKVSEITSFSSNSKEGYIIVTISNDKKVINKYRFDIVTTENSIKDKGC